MENNSCQDPLPRALYMKKKKKKKKKDKEKDKEKTY